MAGMDIFNNNAFSMTSLSAAVEKVDYVPQTLGQLGIFTPQPVRSRNIWVDRREGGLKLISTSALGAPPEELMGDDRSAVPLRTTRLAKGFTMYAYELDGIRAHGSETELMQVQAEYLRRMARVRQDMDLTHEFHRLGALQGLLLDADGTSVIYDYFEEFGVTRPAIVDFELSNPDFDVRKFSNQLARDMIRNSNGKVAGAANIHALAGDEFFDNLITHPKVERTYENWAAAADLRENNAFQSFKFGGITYHNYQGTNDNSTVAIDPDAAHFFPVGPGARDVFTKAMAPAEFGPYINTMGQDTYAMNLVDRDRQAWTRGELYSYPLYICNQPEALRKGRSS